MDPNDENYALALAAHLNVGLEDVVKEAPIPGPWGEGRMFNVDGEEWWVMSDAEADSAAGQSLDSYIDDIIMEQLPEGLRSYFDADKFKRDAILSDGRAHVLSTYDGHEYEYRINGEWYYIYRE